MRNITRQVMANIAAESWQAAYLKFQPSERKRLIPPHVEGIYAKLTQLNPVTPEAVNAIIGNESWTRLTCDHCHQDVEAAVSVDVTRGECVSHICLSCAQAMVDMFSTERVND